MEEKWTVSLATREAVDQLVSFILILDLFLTCNCFFFFLDTDRSSTLSVGGRFLSGAGNQRT